MRDTVLCIVDDCDEDAIVAAVEAMRERVAAYVPGYRLKQRVQFRRFGPGDPECDLISDAEPAHRWVVTVFLEVEGAGMYLPPYAGNLDIMTSAALQVAERMAVQQASGDLTAVAR